MVYADGVEVAELTTSTVRSLMFTYERLLNTTEDTKIRGLFTEIVLRSDNDICFTLIL